MVRGPALVAFSGEVPSGLVPRPNDTSTTFFPVGSNIAVRSLKGSTSETVLLHGHTDKVTAMAVSGSGKYLASGQRAQLECLVTIIIWDLEALKAIWTLSIHKAQVQALDFSANEQYLASVGGPDDGSLILWHLGSGKALCGSPAHPNFTNTVKFFKRRDDQLVTGGHFNLIVWTYDKVKNKLLPENVQLGPVQRVVTAITIDDDDAFAFCATHSGDVLQINLSHRLLKASGPGKKLLHGGATTIVLATSGHLVVGSGDGTIAVMQSNPPANGTKQPARLAYASRLKVSAGAITSIAPCVASSGKQLAFLVGTSACEMYRLGFDEEAACTDAASLQVELVQTAPPHKLNDLVLPQGSSPVAATAGLGEIRLWHLQNQRELLRIVVPGVDCVCLAFGRDGFSIISGWSDGKIRAFGPQSGRLLYTINDAHHQAVTAIDMSSDCKRVISGGDDGLVRVWCLEQEKQSLESSLKQHTAAVSSIQMRPGSNEECVSASADGSCIVWNLRAGKRLCTLATSTAFKAIVYHLDGSQLITTGTDRKITYWDRNDGQPIRVLEASDTAGLAALAISNDSSKLASGGQDGLVKVWDFTSGVCEFVGRGHSGTVRQVAFSSDQLVVVSVGADGAIFMWHYGGSQGQLAT